MTPTPLQIRYLSSVNLATLQLFVKLEVSRITRSKYIQEVPKFKKDGPLSLTPPFLGILRWVLPKYIPNLKFLASPVSNLRKGLYNYKKNLPMDPYHATFGGILSSVRWDLPRFIGING